MKKTLECNKTFGCDFQMLGFLVWKGEEMGLEIIFYAYQVSRMLSTIISE